MASLSFKNPIFQLRSIGVRSSHCLNSTISKSKTNNLAPLKYVLGTFQSTPSNKAFIGDRTTSVDGGAELVVSNADGDRYLRIWYGGGDSCNWNPRVVEARVKNVISTRFVFLTITRALFISLPL
jgi:hypothetical protein